MINGPRRSRIGWNSTEIEASKVRKPRVFSGFPGHCARAAFLSPLSLRRRPLTRTATPRYIALPWWCGHAMFNAGSISAPEVVLTILYSIAGLGIAIVNDFKSIEGDRALGMNSLPVAFGIDTAKWICVASIDVTQLGVAAYLWAIGETWYAAVLAGLVLPQMFSQISFLQDPVNNDVKYQAAAQPFLVFGILTTALAVGHHTF